MHVGVDMSKMGEEACSFEMLLFGNITSLKEASKYLMSCHHGGQNRTEWQVSNNIGKQ